MSSRADEKERRRQERLAAEQAAQKGADRRKRMGIVGGVVLLAAVAVIAVLAIASGGGEGNDPDDNDNGSSAAIPEQRVDNLNEAVRASGCELTRSPIEGRGHTSETVRYRTNPPTSGSHDPTASEDGVYEPGNAPDIEQSVHALEHGRINFQYRKGSPQQLIDQLETLHGEEVKGTAGYHSLLFENQTNMEPAVAATAWGQTLACDRVSDGMWDALRAFRRDRVDKGPEFIP